MSAWRLHTACCCALSPAPSSLAQVLFKCYGKDLMIAGFFKLLWSVFVILGGECMCG